MADTNLDTSQAQQELQRLAEATAQASNEYARSAGISSAAQQRLNDATIQSATGIANFGAKTALGVDALVGLGKAVGSATKAMYDGKKGAAAMNEAITGVTDTIGNLAIAIGMLIPGIGLLVGGVGLAVKALGKYAAAANEMTDKLYSAFKDMSKSGAAASDGLKGLFEGSKKLGFSMNELNDYVQIVSESSRDLAMMGGAVYKGRQAFENIGKAMEPAREGLLKMGLSTKDAAEGQIGYLRTQTRLGNAQKMTTDQLAAGARAYLVEQDALTKLTGQTRKETEKAREDALMDQQFGAKIRELQLKGDEAGAKRLQDMFDMANAVTPELGRSIKALATGNLTNEDAQKLYQSTQGQGLRDLQEVIAGTKTVAQGMDSIAKSVGRTNDTLGVAYGQLGINNSFLMDFGASRKLQLAGEQGFVTQLAQIRKDQIQQGVEGGQAVDPLLERRARLEALQIKVNEETERFVEKGLVPATKAAEAMAEAAYLAAKALNKLTPGDSRAPGGEGTGGAEGQPRRPDPQAAVAAVSQQVAANEVRQGRIGVEEARALLENGYAQDIAAFGGREALEKIANAAAPAPAPAAPAPAPAAPAPAAPAPAAPARRRTGRYLPQAQPESPPAPPAPAAPAAPAASAAPAAPAAPAASATMVPPGGGGGKGGGGKEQLSQTLKPDESKSKSVAGGLDDTALKNMLKKYEGVVPYPYKDTEGFWTIGVGHLIGKTLPPEYAAYANNGPAYGPGSKNNNTTPAWSPEKIDQQLDNDLQRAKAGAEKNTKNFSDMSSQGKIAFTDLAFNMGPSWIQVKGFKKLDKALADKQNENIKKELIDSKWYAQVKGRGPTVVDLASKAFAEKGGAFSGPDSGYPATLHGDEAVIPLNNNSGNFVKMFEDMAASSRQMASMMEEMVRAQKNSNDIQTKILRVQT